LPQHPHALFRRPFLGIWPQANSPTKPGASSGTQASFGAVRPALCLPVGPESGDSGVNKVNATHVGYFS
jgi:hypothetical protein